MSATTDFILEHSGEPWHALLYALAAAALAWWAWRGYGPTVPGVTGWIARICRCVAVAVLVLFIAGPALRTASTVVLPGRLVVAVDRSASMAKEDAPASPGTNQPRSRIALAGEVATTLGPQCAQRQIAVDWRAIGGMDGGIDPQALIAGTVSASGSASVLGDELERLMLSARPDGLVVITDGRVTAGTALSALGASWRERGVPVSVLACGGESVEPELFIDEVVVNREIAKGEREPVTVRMSLRAQPAGQVTVTVTPQGGTPETTQVAVPAGGADMHLAEAKLETVFTHEGPTTLLVAIEGPGGLKRTQQVAVTVRERRLTVLMLEHRPRYETRYLREAFKRDRTVTVHAYLAEGRWRRWGVGDEAEAGPDHLPLTGAELRGYDLVIIGDLGPEALRDDAQQALVQAVRREGVGLVWLPGETGAIAGFSGHALGDLIPVELPDAASIARGYLTGEARQASRTTAAAQLGLLEAGETEWSQLPSLLGASPVVAVKPGAEVLVADQAERPLVVSRAYGTGRAMFLAVDDTWRWRRNVGDRYLHRFHSQLFRYAASGRRLGRQEWRLVASPRRVIAGAPVTISMVPNGPLPESAPDAVSVRLAGQSGDDVERLVRLVREGSGFTAQVPAPAAGLYTLAMAAGVDPRAVDGDQLMVTAPADERRDPRRDLPGLEAFARAVGGKVFTDPAALVAALPDLRHTETLVTVKGLWDTAWMLALLIGLLAVDWAIRRRNRLP